MGLHSISYGDFSKSPVRPYTNCTGQIWYVHWFPSWKVCFGPNSIAVQSWEVCELKIEFLQWRSCVSYREYFKVPCAAVHELYRSNLECRLKPSWKVCFGPNSVAVQSWKVCELEFDFIDCGSLLVLFSYGDFSKSPVQPYTNCTGQIWYVHWFPSWKVCFGPNSIAVQSWEVCALKIEFFQWRFCVSYREFFKVPCAAVHELYRSNLVCTLIPILKGVFWSKQHSCTVIGSMCTENWIFSMEILC